MEDEYDATNNANAGQQQDNFAEEQNKKPGSIKKAAAAKKAAPAKGAAAKKTVEAITPMAPAKVAAAKKSLAASKKQASKATKSATVEVQNTRGTKPVAETVEQPKQDKFFAEPQQPAAQNVAAKKAKTAATKRAPKAAGTAKKIEDNVFKIKESEPSQAPVEDAVPDNVFRIEEIEQGKEPNSLPIATEQQQLQESGSSLKKITFQLKFHTHLGQFVYVTGNHALLGNNSQEQGFALTYLNSEYWVGTLNIPEGESITEAINYHYYLKLEDGSFTAEWGQDKLIQPNYAGVEELLLIDSWNPASLIENTFYTEPFQQVLLKGDMQEPASSKVENITHTFRVKAPLLRANQALCITGSIAELGEWSYTTPIFLSRKEGDVWHTVNVDLSRANFPLSYKYALYDKATERITNFEEGQNRTVYDGYAPSKRTIVSDGFAQLPFTAFKGAGVAIPVFSLRSQQSFGVGEFNDLKLMVDWAKQAKLKLVQLLPVNDTTATHSYLDSYPYAAISAFALHPLYLHLPSVLTSENKGLYDALQQKQQELNQKPVVDYVAVMKEKWDFLKQVFPLQKERTFASSDFVAFFKENAHWLIPYAAFSYQREKNNTSDFSQWTSLQVYDAQQVNELAGDYSATDNEISIYYFVQYHLHCQLRSATDYAHQNGIIIKGDIPIGIYRNSCDAWQEPELFYMDMQAGAPPDDFAVKGQNWGFPTYNWHRMAADGFSWWRKRFHQMSYYFDAFRIDHILGFFRIWSIPIDSVQGIMGHFVPAVPLHVNEITGRGVHFNYDRLCKPYIVESQLWRVFENDTEWVANDFLDRLPNEQYQLKPAFDTQRKIEQHFAALETTGQHLRVKEGLFDLLNNVLLFPVKGSEGEQFHFRIAMQQTSSFQHLDDHTKHVLDELYENYFYRRQDHYWMKEAMLKLPELKRSTNMLICGEDLGMVPACVPGVMRELAILSLEIQRMPKDPSREFFHPNDAPYLSVVTPSTHDMSTIRGWWEEDRAATQRFYNNELGQWGTAPYFCEPWVNRIILQQHFYSPAMWSIFQLQDLLGISETLRRENPHEERINVPADPKHYWRYRMHLTLEQLLHEDRFTSEIAGYVTESGR